MKRRTWRGTLSRVSSETPLAARVHGRSDLAAFAAPAALVEPLHTVLHVWPVDGDLPTLVDATDPGLMAAVLGEELPRALVEPVDVRRCDVWSQSFTRTQPDGVRKVVCRTFEHSM